MPWAENLIKRELIMQNKPNFMNPQNGFNFSNTNDYELRTTNYELFKNKPKQTQFMASVCEYVLRKFRIFSVRKTVVML